MLGHRALTVEDYVSIAKRRAWMIAVPAIILPIVAYGLTFLIAPQYISQTLVLIEGQKIPDNYVKPVVSSSLDDRLASMKEQIYSRSRIAPIIDKYNLYSTSQLSMDDRVEKARKGIEIKPITSEVAHSSGLPGFFVSFKADDPHTAQLVCGEITSLFVGENLKGRTESAEGTVNFIKSQLEDAKRNLDQQDSQLATFESKYIGRLPGQDSPNLNMLQTLNTQLEAATQALSRIEQDKTYQESMLAQQVQASQPTTKGEIGGAGPSAQQVELQNLVSQENTLAGQYTAEYPDLITVRRKIADLRRQIARSAAAPAQSSTAISTAPSKYDSASVQQLRAQIQSTNVGIEAKRKEQAQIQAAIRTYQDRIQSSPMVEQQYKQLTRDHETAQKIYDDLQMKMNNAEQAMNLEKRQEGEQFHVMDEPNLPDAPFSPRRGAFVIAGLAVGLAFGLLVVAGIEYKDKTLRSERDIWAFTQLPTLAIIGTTEFPGAGKPSRLWQLLNRKSLQRQGG